jgi:Uma2 family endonuclease
LCPCLKAGGEAMIYAEPGRRYTLEEYLELDRLTDAKYEWHNGEVVEISGVSLAHAEIEMNLLFRLHLHLKQAGRGGKLFTGSIHIKVPSLPPYRYADLSVSSGEPEFEKIGGVDALTNPALLVEVLSPSTEGYDRGDKFSHYKSIPSFCEYLLVAQHRPYVSHFVRRDDVWWVQREYSDLQASVKLASLGCELTLGEIYENVAFESVTHPHLHPLA